MFSVQLGTSVSTGIFDSVGPIGAASLRLCFAAVIILVLVRPRRPASGEIKVIALYGFASALMTIFYFSAVARIPLGVASSLEFLGPLAIGLFAARSRLGLAAPLVAFGGVVCLTEPWAIAESDPLGLIFGSGAG
ncbi:EamA family transporter, partial [Gordonia shandongensis]|uniref:EamA family transporter n=1 Tax=Gordonia shandongensis TaxID=376351 RepID=UPI003CCBD4DB